MQKVFYDPVGDYIAIAASAGLLKEGRYLQKNIVIKLG